MGVVYNGVRYDLTVEDIAKMFGYHPTYVRDMARTGALPAIKRGRQWLFNEQQVLQNRVSEPALNDDILEGV